MGHPGGGVAALVRSSLNFTVRKDLVEWAIALHGMYKSALFFEIGELTDSNLFALYCTITTIHPVN